MLDSFGRLAGECDLVLVEGAGSASEVNLRANDIANMGFARAADVPVVLVGDIDRGGVIASLVGTKAVIDAADADMIVGFIVNRFRGDPTLFDDGMKTVSERTGWRALGLVPFFDEAHRLPAEDAVVLQDQKAGSSADGRIRIAVLVYPRIANFDDFDPLRLDPGVDLVFVGPHQPVPGDTKLIILPGSKSTIADLASLRAIRLGHRPQGASAARRLRAGHLRRLPDARPHHRRSARHRGTAAEGRWPRPVRRRHGARRRQGAGRGERRDHRTAPCRSRATRCMSAARPARCRPLLKLGNGQTDGAVSGDGRVAGCYIHGLLADDRQRQHWLKLIGGQASGFDYEADVDATLDLLADHLEKHVDCDRLLALARAQVTST